MERTLGTRGFSRGQREFSVLAEGRHTVKTWQKPETALEKFLAPRVMERNGANENSKQK